MAHLRARIHPPWNAEKSLSPLKKFFPFQERRIAVTCSFFCEKRKKERRKGARKRASSKGERTQEEGRRGGVGGIVSPSGPQKSVAELEGLFVFN